MQLLKFEEFLNESNEYKLKLLKRSIYALEDDIDELKDQHSQLKDDLAKTKLKAKIESKKKDLVEAKDKLERFKKLEESHLDEATSSEIQQLETKIEDKKNQILDIQDEGGKGSESKENALMHELKDLKLKLEKLKKKVNEDEDTD